jgi:hypothetical protein
MSTRVQTCSPNGREARDSDSTITHLFQLEFTGYPHVGIRAETSSEYCVQSGRIVSHDDVCVNTKMVRKK